MRDEIMKSLFMSRNACISLCVQSPSSPSNPSVSVCGVETVVEQLYKIFIEYHLITEEEPDLPPNPPNPSRTHEFNMI